MKINHEINNENEISNEIILGIDIGGTSVKIGIFRKNEEYSSGDIPTERRKLSEIQSGNVSGRTRPESEPARTIPGDSAGSEPANAGITDIIGSTANRALPKGSALTIIDSFQIPTRLEQKGKFILPDAADAASSRLAALGLSWNDVSGIGIGVPGPVVNMDGEDVVTGCVNLGWEHVSPAREFRKRIYPMYRCRMVDRKEECAVPAIHVANDANVAALGERYFGAGRDRRYSNVVMIAIGTGIGAGILVDGKILSGANGAAGEIGHMKIRPEARPEGVLPEGMLPFADLEYYASARGIAETGRRMRDASREPSVLDGMKPMTSRDIFDAAKSGDPVAVRIAEFFFSIMGNALAAVATVLDPDAFFIGGGISGAGEYLRAGIERKYRGYAFPACRDTEIRLAELGGNAGMYGAAALMI